MEDTKKSPSTFGLGLVIGTVLGGLAAFFLSPQSGKENREEFMDRVKAFKKSLDQADIPVHVREIYGEASKESIKLYTQVRKELVKEMADMKDKVDEFDPDKYMELIDDTVEHVRAEMDETTERANKLKEYLIKSWGKTLNPAKKKAVKKSK